MKALAFHDRHTPRDLFDLAGLARIGAVDPRAIELLVAQAGHGFIRAEVERVPTSVARQWDVELRHQVVGASTPQACARAVLDALDAL